MSTITHTTILARCNCCGQKSRARVEAAKPRDTEAFLAEFPIRFGRDAPCFCHACLEQYAELMDKPGRQGVPVPKSRVYALIHEVTQ